jgi:hypothetical protein
VVEYFEVVDRVSFFAFCLPPLPPDSTSPFTKGAPDRRPVVFPTPPDNDLKKQGQHFGALPPVR